MSAEMAEHAINMLTENYGQDFTPLGLDRILDELSAAPDKAVERAVDHTILNFNRLPAPDRLMERVRFEAKLILAAEARERESEWHKQKGGSTRQELDKQPTIFDRAQATAHARKALTVMKLTINKEIPRSVVISDLREMDKEFPGFGYGVIADDFQRQWGC